MITSASPVTHVARCDHDWDLSKSPPHCAKCLQLAPVTRYNSVTL